MTGSSRGSFASYLPKFEAGIVLLQVLMITNNFTSSVQFTRIIIH